jgi:hypothetical protein
MDVLGFTSRPIGEDMLKNVGGPSADFVLGRIVKNATSTAYNMAKVAESDPRAGTRARPAYRS